MRWRHFRVDCHSVRYTPRDSASVIAYFTQRNIRNNIHSSQTPKGMEAHAVAEVTEVNGRELTFHVVAYDRCGKIGEGMHKRVVVHADRFMEKTNAKKLK